jgi:NTE family protein
MTYLGREPARLMLALALIPLGGCAMWPKLGDPIERVDPESGYRLSLQPAERRSDDIFFMTSFSGGGARAAALAYGVLQQLSRDRIHHDGADKPLLAEVDLISAVSGGSVTATAYALHGDRFFTDFEDRFLKRKMERAFWISVFNPYNLARLASARFARGDLLAELLDKRLYGRSTYGDLLGRPDRPFVVVGVADVSGGGRLEFTQTQFDALCLDLSTYPIARAVAASGAAPPTLTPITLRSYAGNCGYRAPRWVIEQASLDPASSRRAALAREMMRYQDRNLIKYLHLVDGSVSDDLAIRTAIDAIDAVAGTDDPADPVEFLRVRRPKKIVFISVDAASLPGLRVAGRARAPSELTAARLAALVSVNRNSIESKIALRSSLELVVQKLSQQEPVELYYIEVSPDKLADAARRDDLMSVPTSFNLAPAVIDRVACSGGEILSQSTEYIRLVKDLAGNAPRTPDCHARP